MNEKTAYLQGYRVDESGNVWSSCGKKRVLDLWDGYYRFTISMDGKKRSVMVHRLAAFQWFGECPIGLGVRHLDGDSHNNRQSNLSYGTQSQNMMDKTKDSRIATARIAAKSLRKLTDEEAEQLRNDRNNGLSYSQLVNKYGVSKSTISYIVNRKTYATVEERPSSPAP